MSKWDRLKIAWESEPDSMLGVVPIGELKELIAIAEKAEEYGRPSPPKSVVQEIWDEMQYFQPANMTDPWRRATAALAEAVEAIEGLNYSSGGHFHNGMNASILSILRGEKTRDIPK